MVADWYGRETQTVEVVSAMAIWHSTGLPTVPLRWVLIRDPRGEFATQALLCTDLHADPERIISWFVRRCGKWRLLFKRFVSAWGSRRRGIGRRERSGRPLPALLAHQRMAQGSRASFAIRGLLLQTLSDLLRCSGAGEKGVVAQEGPTFCGSAQENDAVKGPRKFVERLPTRFAMRPDG